VIKQWHKLTNWSNNIGQITLNSLERQAGEVTPVNKQIKFPTITEFWPMDIEYKF